jgi:peptidoglycan hydrolase-like protein with peptidoglycan-binding domain
MKKLALVPFVAALFAYAPAAFAQMYYPSYPAYPSYSGASQCVNISQNLSYGSRSGEVTQLQSFLVSQGLGGNNIVTGYFGTLTRSALISFQNQHGLSSSGVLDASTRSMIASLTCGYSQNTGNNYNYNQYNPWDGYGYNNQYPYNQYNNQYNNNPYDQYNNNWYSNQNYTNYVNLNLTSLSVNTGMPGTSVTVYGSGFDAVNNTVYFGSYSLGNIPSDGSSISFTVPSYYYNSYSGWGNPTEINIHVTNSRGTSNSLSFYLISYNASPCGYGNTWGSAGYGECGCNNYGGYPYTYGNNWYTDGYSNGSNNCYNVPTSNVQAPTISYLDPTSGGVGTTVTIYGTGFTSTGNTIRFGTGIMANLQSPDGRSVSFIVPSRLTGYGSQNVGLGSYDVSVTNGVGRTTSVKSFTVTSLSGGNQSGGYVVINYLTPTIGHVGTQITISGTGFSAYDNTVHFGVGGLMHVPSYNGTTLYFTVPSSLSPCDVLTSGSYCAAYLQQVTPDSYPVFVSSGNGSSNTMFFQVQ